MRLSTYPVQLHSPDVYMFASNEVMGVKYKLVMFTEVGPDQYNLALVNHDPKTVKVDDYTLSGNNDARRIFATVAAIVEKYTLIHPEREIVLEGNTQKKKQSYSTMISYFLGDILIDFNVLGSNEVGATEPFEKAKSYDFILVKRK